ncbi:MAG TPA: hypothetical protein VNZ03_00690 [Terriglobales bacterium]|jgi:hypothetical protein|nr:hypothetical protein [Terriglobales bacterium]
MSTLFAKSVAVDEVERFPVGKEDKASRNLARGTALVESSGNTEQDSSFRHV